jgi:hypothetical protein
MKKCLSFLLAVVTLIPLMLVGMQAQTAQLKRTVMGSGGMVGISNASGVKISGQTGQFAIGTVTNSTPGSTSYYLNQGFWVPSPTIGTDVEEQPVSSDKDLYNYPNPASTNTTIEFNLQAASYVTLKVYDMMGKEAKILLDGFQTSGVQKIVWDTKGDNGLALPAGSYLYELQIRSTDMAGAGSFNSYALRNVLIIVR